MSKWPLNLKSPPPAIWNAFQMLLLVGLTLVEIILEAGCLKMHEKNCISPENSIIEVGLL